MPPCCSRASALVLALVLTLGASARPARADCPVDSVGFGSYGRLTTTAARFDSTVTTYGTFRAHYDLGIGLLEVSQCCNLEPTFVDVSDDFDVVGVPPGTPVSCWVEFATNGMIQTPGGVIVTTLEAGGVVQTRTHVTNQNLGWYPISDQLQQNLTLVAGTPQRIRFALAGRRTVGSAIDASGSDAHGGYSFGGLPAGVKVVSCQGYPGGIVPTHTPTWGSLKARYR